MTFQHISISFDTHKRHGTCDIAILSKKEFLKLARRVGDVSNHFFDQPRPFISYDTQSSCLTLPRRCTINHFLMSSEEGLKFVYEDNQLWLGFIPFYDPADGPQKSEGRGRKIFTHYRLDDILKPIGRIVCKQNSVSLFSLPLTAKINKEKQLCSINNVSFLLLFNKLETEGALVCCPGPLPSVPLAPVLFCRQINPNIQEIPSTKETGHVSIPFLKAKNSGFVHFPIWSLDQWDEEIKKRLTKDGCIKSMEKHLFKDMFIIFPCGVSFDQNQEIKGTNCVFVRYGPYVRMAFFPERESNRTHRYQVQKYNSYLIETFSDDAKNHYLSSSIFSFIILANNTYFVDQKGSSNLELRGSSLLFLASEDGTACRLCYKKGDFELKCTRPTDYGGDVFPIERLLEQPSAVEPSEKKSRIEEGETSQVAMEESRIIVEARRKKASRSEKEQEETSQRAIEESRIIVEARKEEEAKMACAEALVLFSQQE